MTAEPYTVSYGWSRETGVEHWSVLRRGELVATCPKFGTAKRIARLLNADVGRRAKR